MNSNEVKESLLGEKAGTAQHKLRKLIMFDLVQQTNRDICYRCKRPIELIEELSIEHKEAWQSSPDPRKSFFDLDNIAFSHLSCNVANNKGKHTAKTRCKNGHPYIHKDKKGHNYCNICRATQTAVWREKNKDKYLENQFTYNRLPHVMERQRNRYAHVA